MLQKKSLILLLVIFIISFIYHFETSLHFAEGEIKFQQHDVDDRRNLTNLSFSFSFSNNHFLLNQNLVQYSSYIFMSTNQQHYRIEGFVDWHFDQYYRSIRDFRCLVKLGTEVFETEPFEMPRMYYNQTRKLICRFSEQNFTSFKDGDIHRVLVAFINATDYRRELDNVFFKNINSYTSNHFVQLPYLLINYQRPTVVVERSPLKPSIGFCVQFTYTAVPRQTADWIRLHLAFGIEEIRMYDATDDRSLTKLIETEFRDEGRLTVMPFYQNDADVCKDDELFRMCRHHNNGSCGPVLEKYLKEKCIKTYLKSFKNKQGNRGRFNQLTSNDCFTVMRKKYEYVVNYDLDEVVFPRSVDAIDDFYGMNASLTCRTEQICNSKPMPSFYNYIKFIIEKYAKNRDVSKLDFISFAHAVYMEPNHVEKSLMADISEILRKIDGMGKLLNSSMFPMKLFLTDRQSTGEIFTIKKDDIDYLRYLNRTYSSYIPCFNSRNLSGLNPTFNRYFYFATTRNQRMGKCVFSSSNVKTVFVHYPMDVENRTWSIRPSEQNGHLLSHFRQDAYRAVFSRHTNHTVSIRNLNIDYEYTFLMIKNFTRFCD